MISDTTIRAITCTSPSTFSSVEVFTYTFTDSSSGGGGGGSSDPTEIPGAPTCIDDAAYCPPGAPLSGNAAGPFDPPRFGNVIANTVASFSRDLSEGMTGADVAYLQQFFISRRTGLAVSALAKVGATGYFGSLTRNAVIEFQKSLGITPAVGYFGPKTRARFNALTGVLPNGALGADSSVTTSMTLQAPVAGSAAEILTAPTAGVSY